MDIEKCVTPSKDIVVNSLLCGKCRMKFFPPRSRMRSPKQQKESLELFSPSPLGRPIKNDDDVDEVVLDPATLSPVLMHKRSRGDDDSGDETVRLLKRASPALWDFINTSDNKDGLLQQVEQFAQFVRDEHGKA